ncbi:MAG: hypothetical protein AAGF24_15140, partial [Cyanobacteria bacterium P01_H01_bin.121]
MIACIGIHCVHQRVTSAQPLENQAEHQQGSGESELEIEQIIEELSAPIPPDLRRVWEPLPNADQLSREELEAAFRESPFAFVTEALGDIPELLLRTLLKINPTALKPWEVYQVVIESGMPPKTRTATDLLRPTTKAEVSAALKVYTEALEHDLRTSTDHVKAALLIPGW